MQEPTTAIAVKSAATTATAAAAAFGLTGWAIAAALAGATASLHWQKEAAPSTVWKLMGLIAAQGFFAAMLASALPSIPFTQWTGDIPVAARAGILGVLASPAYMAASMLVEQVRDFFTRKLGG